MSANAPGAKHKPPSYHRIKNTLLYQRALCIGRQGKMDIGLSEPGIVVSLRAMGRAVHGHGATGHATHGPWLRA